MTFPPKLSLSLCHVGLAEPPMAASGHRLRLGLCLVGPDVRLVGVGAGLVGLVWFVGPLCWYDTASDILCNCVVSFVCFCSIPGMGACNPRITKTHGND